MSIVEAPPRPDVGDSAYYSSAASNAKKVRVSITQIFRNGRIKVEFPDGSWKSLAPNYRKRVKNERYGLVRIE